MIYNPETIKTFVFPFLYFRFVFRLNSSRIMPPKNNTGKGLLKGQGSKKKRNRASVTFGSTSVAPLSRAVTIRTTDPQPNDTNQTNNGAGSFMVDENKDTASAAPSHGQPETSANETLTATCSTPMKSNIFYSKDVECAGAKGKPIRTVKKTFIQWPIRTVKKC